MRERPILFSAPMVRAILGGAKTQTRRTVKQIAAFADMARDVRDDRALRGWKELAPNHLVQPSPYGKAGDRLWVKETWRPHVAIRCAMDACDGSGVDVVYAANGKCRFFPDREIARSNPGWRLPKAAERGNVSPLFMPRWACRLLLEVRDVRVERLHSISEEDAIAEGIDGPLCAELSANTPWADRVAPAAVHAYAALWDRINGAGAWCANPWVWVVDFKRVTDIHD